MCEFGWTRLEPEDKAHILRGVEAERALTSPRAVQIDWTDRCTSRCVYCTQRHVRGEAELSLPVLERLFDELTAMGIKGIQVAGGGEPLFHREILEVLDALARRALPITTLVTNGILLSGGTAERVLEGVTHRVIVSLNSSGEKEWKAFTGASTEAYHRVQDNLRSLAREKRSRGKSKPILTVQFLVHDSNADAMPRMLELAESMGVDEVVFNPVHCLDQWSRGIARRPEAFLQRVRALYATDRSRIIADVQTLYSDLNREIVRWREREHGGDYPEVTARHRRYYELNAGCALSWFFLHIKATGDVFPCCYLLTDRDSPIGNIHEALSLDLWEGARMRTFRRSMADYIKKARPGAAASPGPPLPALCTTTGRCMIRHIPYLDDGPFYIAMDALSRAPASNRVLFPPLLVPGREAEICGQVPSGPEWGAVEIRINHLRAGAVACRDGRFAFPFAHDPLRPGFHLLEVLGGGDSLLAARMVEKPGSD